VLAPWSLLYNLAVSRETRLPCHRSVRPGAYLRNAAGPPFVRLGEGLLL
jgi:hypothetical protein